jgi:hypothetical protein
MMSFAAGLCSIVEALPASIVKPTHTVMPDTSQDRQGVKIRHYMAYLPAEHFGMEEPQFAGYTSSHEPRSIVLSRLRDELGWNGYGLERLVLRGPIQHRARKRRAGGPDGK